jgi:hypothetical protein
MDISRKPPCRLAFLFAASAPVVVILRRGPSRRVKMVVWNTKTDHFVDGEWWHGRIYEDRCGLSPDGRLVFARSGVLYRLVRHQEHVVRDFNPDQPPSI